MTNRQKYFNVLFVLFGLLGLAGCGTENKISTEACKFDVEILLNEGSYDASLAKVADSSCSGLTISEASMYKATAYMGKAGLSFRGFAADIGALLDGSGDPISLIGSKVSGATSMTNLKNASLEYDLVIGTSNCTTTTNSVVKTACSAKDVVSPMLAISSMSVLGGEAVTYNGQLISPISAMMNPTSVGITSGTATEFDVDGDGNFDNSQAAAMALQYSFNGTTIFGDNTITNSYGNRTFTNPSSGPFELIKSTIVAVAPMSKNTINWHLVNQASASTVTTEGYCSLQNVACTKDEVDGSANCYPCPIIDSRGQTSTSTENILSSINSADSTSPLASAGDAMDCDQSGTVSNSELSTFMTYGKCQ